jgi:hypothetical protein
LELGRTDLSALLSSDLLDNDDHRMTKTRKEKKFIEVESEIRHGSSLDWRNTVALIERR